MVNFLGHTDRQGLREWLEQNHSTEKECSVVIRRGAPSENVLWYVDAVEEALCFGWIDSTLRELPTGENVQRFVPRRKDSHWSELNKERCRRLERLGLMTDAGRAVMPDLDEEFVISDDILKALQEDAEAWENFLSFPEPYRRIRIGNIESVRKDGKAFDERLKKLAETSKAGRMYGQWNDYGRL